MENLDFLGEKHSSKNIPLPSKKEYMKQLIYAVGKFINALRWRVYFYKMKTESDKEKKKHENHPTVSWERFKQNYKNFQQDLCRIEEYASADLAQFDMIQAESAVLPSSWIPRP